MQKLGNFLLQFWIVNLYRRTYLNKPPGSLNLSEFEASEATQSSRLAYIRTQLETVEKKKTKPQNGQSSQTNACQCRCFWIRMSIIFQWVWYCSRIWFCTRLLGNWNFPIKYPIQIDWKSQGDFLTNMLTFTTLFYIVLQNMYLNIFYDERI